MKLYIKDMTDEQLNEWAARAQGWTKQESNSVTNEGRLEWVGTKGEYKFFTDVYNPVTNGQQAMDLVVKFRLELTIGEEDWWARKCWHPRAEKPKSYAGSTPNKAIVRAVIASKYGEYVTIED